MIKPAKRNHIHGTDVPVVTGRTFFETTVPVGLEEWLDGGY